MLIFYGRRQQQRRTPSPTGQAQAPVWQDPEGLVLPDDRLIVCGVMGILGLDQPGLLPFLAAQLHSGRDVGDELLTERLHILAMGCILPTFSALLGAARAEPLALGPRLRMEPRSRTRSVQRRPASACSACHWGQGHSGESNGPQRDEPHDTGSSHGHLQLRRLLSAPIKHGAMIPALRLLVRAAGSRATSRCGPSMRSVDAVRLLGAVTQYGR
jgi:hypothetical protein